MEILILIVCCLLALFLGGCHNKPKPEPEPYPKPEDEWKDFYPSGWYQPTDWDKRKWQERAFNTDLWWEYENKLIEFMRIQGRNIFDALALARVLTVKINGQYYFKWTSDMETWQEDDYWATPYQFVIEKKGKGDCDDFAGLHCDYLYRMSKLYWLVWWIEVYWKQRYWNALNSTYGWKYLGHAITILKETSTSSWKCFSNQQFLGMTNGYETIGEIVSKFCPKDDNHELIKVVARHPIKGDLLWVIDENHGADELLLTIKQLKNRKETI